MEVQYKAEAIILTARDAGSSDRIFTLFSKEYGKISAIAYGVRLSKKRRAGSLQPFAHLDFELSKGKGNLYVARQWLTKTSFQKLREDLFLMAHASFLCELTNDLWPENEGGQQMFDLILRSFRLLESRNPRIAALAGALKIISAAGFQPCLQMCVQCGHTAVDNASFSAACGGVVCASCQNNGILRPLAKLTPWTKDMRRFFAFLEDEKIFSEASFGFSVSSQTLSQTEELLVDYLNCQLERPLKTVAFLKELNLK